jgi:hypothetical protein
MANYYAADEYETDALRTIFGATVTEVKFRDAESGRGRYVEVEGKDTHGEVVRVVTRADTKEIAELEEIASMRAITVDFGLDIPTGD